MTASLAAISTPMSPGRRRRSQPRGRGERAVRIRGETWPKRTRWPTPPRAMEMSNQPGPGSTSRTTPAGAVSIQGSSG
jgi:hypothetical protein